MEMKYHNIRQQTEFTQLSSEIVKFSWILVYFDIKIHCWFLFLETAADKTISAQGQFKA